MCFDTHYVYMQEHREELQDKAMSSLFHLVCDLYKVSALYLFLTCRCDGSEHLVC